MGTFIVAAVVLALVVFIIKGIVRDKKNGKSIQCGMSCKDCGGHCGH